MHVQAFVRTNENAAQSRGDRFAQGHPSLHLCSAVPRVGTNLDHPRRIALLFWRLTRSIALAFSFAALSGLLGPTAGHAADPSGASWEKVHRVFDEIRARYPSPVDQDAMANRAIRSMLMSLDPYSTFLDESAYRALQQEVRGSYVGLGLEVALNSDALTVLSSMEDTPAFRADLRAGDRITMLDGVSVAGLTLDQALNLARGDVDSNLHLTVMRSGEDSPRAITVRRALVPRASVRDWRLDRGFAYLHIEHFDQSTAYLVTKALNRLGDPASPRIAGMVMDLRGNPGGSVRAAVAVAAEFLPEHSLVVSLEGPSIGPDSQLYSHTEDANATAANGAPVSRRAFAKTVPLVVLVDGGSASASEILAGALQDHRRALLVGTKTFGKGLVQSILPLGDGTAIKLTVARYLTPGGRAIQGVGIEPDAQIGSDNAHADDGSLDLQLHEALRILEMTVAPDRKQASAVLQKSAMDTTAPLPVAQPASLAQGAR
ncbi:MAG: S41 family peptidase [Betaproteobacteria bacterium]